MRTILKITAFSMCLLTGISIMAVSPIHAETATTKTKLFDAYPSWAATAWCEAAGFSNHDVCVSDLKKCASDREFDTLACPTIGICSYSYKRELKSRDFCLLYQAVNSRSWHGIFQWKNNNKLRLDDFHDKTLMNDVRVKEQPVLGGHCYNTPNGKEEFCFTKDESKPFGTDLADALGIDGTWITPDTTCTNRLIPMDGGIAVVENNFDNPEPSILISYDDILGGDRMGIEGGSCSISDVKKIGHHSYTGTSQCGGEGIDAKRSMAKITVRPDQELLLSIDGKREQYIQCGAVSEQVALLNPPKNDNLIDKQPNSQIIDQKTSTKPKLPASGKTDKRIAEEEKSPLQASVRFPRIDVGRFQSDIWFLDREKNILETMEFFKNDGWEVDGRFQGHLVKGNGVIERFDSGLHTFLKVPKTNYGFHEILVALKYVATIDNFFLKSSHFSFHKGDEQVTIKMLGEHIVEQASYTIAKNYNRPSLERTLAEKYGRGEMLSKRTEIEHNLRVRWLCHETLAVDPKVCPSLTISSSPGKFRTDYSVRNSRGVYPENSAFQRIGIGGNKIENEIWQKAKRWADANTVTDEKPKL